MRTSWTIILTASGLVAAPVHGQAAGGPSSGAGLRGLRIEANAGGDRYSSLGEHRTKFGYGASIGADGQMDRFVLGVEASYWRDSKQVVNCITGGAGTLCNSSGRRELGAAVRAGYAFTPQWLVFAKAGYVEDRQRDVFASSGGTFYVNGQFVPGPPSSDTKFNRSGYELGAGIEYSMMSHVYADAQYVYARYSDGTGRNRAMVGLGYRF